MWSYLIPYLYNCVFFCFSSSILHFHSFQMFWFTKLFWFLLSLIESKATKSCESLFKMLECMCKEKYSVCAWCVCVIKHVYINLVFINCFLLNCYLLSCCCCCWSYCCITYCVNFWTTSKSQYSLFCRSKYRVQRNGKE